MSATRLARLLAALLDGAVAVLVAVAAALRSSGEGGVVSATAVAVLAAGLFALRDVPSGASLAKWLLGLHVLTARGTRPSLLSRILRAPWSLLPLAWLFPPLERRTPWRVAAYTPSPAGLAVRLVAAALLLAGGGAAAYAALRPGIGRADARQLAETTIAADPLLQRVLGAPIELELGTIAPRRTLRAGAVFELHAYGPRGSQTMTVVARRVGDGWAVEEIVDIETVTVGGAAGPNTNLVRRDAE